MAKSNEALTYDTMHKIHCEELSSFWDKRQETTHELMDEILVIRYNLKKLINNKDTVINSTSQDQKDFIRHTIDELTDSFKELDLLIDNLQTVTNSYDFELSKFLNIVNDETNSLGCAETEDLISHEKEVITCPNCSISFTYRRDSSKCPSCETELIDIVK